VVEVADARLVILAPEDRSAGPLADFAAGPNAGVYALAWRLADPEAGAGHFSRNDIPVRAIAGGDYSHELVLDGARHWFARI
jgi:hypothetical protein